MDGVSLEFVPDEAAAESRPAGPGRRPMRAWNLRVVAAETLTLRTRRVHLEATELPELAYHPGQALSFQMPLPEGGTGRRDYTIRSLDRSQGRLAIDVVLKSGTPSTVWALNAQPGDEITAHGPRGRTFLDENAHWHLFSGDETALPAILHMLEHVPATQTAFAFLEVADEADELAVSCPARFHLHWVRRDGRLPGPSDLLPDAISAFSLPDGPGHAYIIGETSNVRRQRQGLIARGMARTAISAEGYWRPGRVGGNDILND